MPTLEGGRATEILETSGGDTGTIFDVPTIYRRAPHFVMIEIASGDTVELRGDVTGDSTPVLIKSYTSSVVEQLYLPARVQAVRTTDGTSGDSIVTIEII